LAFSFFLSPDQFGYLPLLALHWLHSMTAPAISETSSTGEVKADTSPQVEGLALCLGPHRQHSGNEICGLVAH
jgi:hypothetical protein